MGLDNPIPAMQGLIKDSPVIYVGTFSKVLFPSLRIGYIVVPVELARQIEPILSFTGQHPSLVLQAALSEFMQKGYFSRHLKKMRKLYASRRIAFLNNIDEHLKDWLDPVDGRTGIQVACLANKPLDDVAVAQVALASGLSIAPLSKYGLHAPAQNGFVLGYAAASEKKGRDALSTLRDIMSTHVCGSSSTKLY